MSVNSKLEDTKIIGQSILLVEKFQSLAVQGKKLLTKASL